MRGEGGFTVQCVTSPVAHVKTHKLLQVCKQVVDKLCSTLSDLLQVCSNKSDTVMI